MQHKQGNEPEQRRKRRRRHGEKARSRGREERRGAQIVRDDGGSERLSLVQVLEEFWIISGITRDETRRDEMDGLLFGGHLES